MKNFVVSFFTSLFVSIIVVMLFHFVVVPELEKQKMVAVPNVGNISVDQAKTMLQTANLVGAVDSEVEDERLPKGTVIKQDPPAGASVTKQSVVKIVVSKPSENATIPNVVGLSLNEAQNMLIAARLNVGEITQVASASASPGKVLSMEPAAMSVVSKGTLVKLKIAIALEKVTVPNVLGKKLEEATSILRSAGLNIGKITNKTDEEKEFDIIIGQIPSAGSKINKGSAVNIVNNSEAE